MLAVSIDYQVQGLGRCWTTSVEHNNIYLQCPTTKSLHVYRCHSGILSMVIGHQSNGIPIPVARVDVDEDTGKKSIRFSTTAEIAKSYSGLARQHHEGWSNDLALKSVPTVCSKIVSMLFAKKDKADFYKLLAAHNCPEVELHYMKNTDNYRFYLSGKEVDLEHILHYLIEKVDEENGYHYYWYPEEYEDVLDPYAGYMSEVFGGTTTA